VKPHFHPPQAVVLPIASILLLLVGLAGTANAQQIPPPVCPSKDCSKVITFYNNTPTAIFPVIQAGIQNPDPWLQALFNDNTQPFAETHYSRVYINPVNGIPTKGHVSVTVPWYSELTNDNDRYIDWFNGGRVFLFDSAAALNAAHEADKKSPLSLTSNSPVVSCDDCEQPLTIYKDTLAFPSSIPFQLVEYTFADVGTPAGGKPFIIDLNVGYNVSYLDQIYLPVALAPCRTEPCNNPDPSAVGYLGTIQGVKDFRSTLTKFSNTEGWPRYNDPLDDAQNPRLPGAYNVLVDRVNVVEKHQPSQFTAPGVSVKNMIDQWQICTSDVANPTNCPQYATYQEIDSYFKANYDLYRRANSMDCPPSADYPIPTTLTPLNIMPYVYGWVQFNSGCPPAFNALLTSPGPKKAFDQALFDYVHLLQYNYRSAKIKQQFFNPFVDLVHGQLEANGYAFSVDDAVSFQNHPGEGLIIAIGGASGLPNGQPIVPPPDFTTDFLVSLGDSKAQNRPLWKSYGICKDSADAAFPPLPPDAKVDTPQIIVDTAAFQISPSNPCTITITDASNSKYSFTIHMPVPWPSHSGTGFDTQVMTCVNKNDGWCTNINELSIPAPNPQFVLFTPPPQVPPLGSGKGPARR
jgi:hypothetical protein